MENWDEDCGGLPDRLPGGCASRRFLAVKMTLENDYLKAHEGAELSAPLIY